MDSRKQIGPIRSVWFLVAHRAGARIFESSGKASDLHLVQEFEYPEGRNQNREIVSDKQGMRYHSIAGSHQGHGLDPHVEAVEHVADVFAKSLAERLKEGRTRQEFENLVLISEPSFLGKLRLFLDRETAKHVVASHNYNLTHLPNHELRQRLGKLLLEARKSA